MEQHEGSEILVELLVKESNTKIKDALSQYCDMRQEKEEKRLSIDRLEKQIKKLREEGEVIDSVTGGSGGTEHFKIKGFPNPECSKKKMILRKRINQLEEMEMNLLEQTNLVEEYINKISDSRIRRIISFRFIDDLTWVNVARRMGGSHTEDSCRKSFERFFDL